ncbi:MAG: MGMT family protein [Candidatus Methylomirabilales bacterium]
MDKRLIATGRLHPGMTFNERVWALCARVPPGKVTTYGEIAHKLGTRAYRAVGNALHKNPYAPTVPCHRVVGSTGDLTGFASGLRKKQQMLEAEGIAIHNGRLNLQKHLYHL